MSEHENASENQWRNGVTIRKTRDGYSWTVAVAADSNSAEDMAKAVEVGEDIEKRLAKRYRT